MEICKSTPFGLSLTECSDALRLGTDSFLLSSYIRRQSNDNAMEFGAGSGVISLLLAKRNCFKTIHAIEVQPEPYDILKNNVTENGFEDLIAPVNADIRNLNPENYKNISVIFSNPPYMKADSGRASAIYRKQTARHEINGGVIDFCRSASKILKTGGRLYLVYRPDRLETLMYALTENKFAPKRMTFVHATERHSPSTVLCEAILDGGEQLKITRPLILNTGNVPSPDCEFIYKNGIFPEDFYKL